MDKVFKALADPTRRDLLDQLFEQDGQSLSALQSRVDMTRFGVMKHLGVLEEAGLVTTRRRGREKLHYLNTVPIRLVHDRWVSKYAEPWAAALSQLKTDLEDYMMDTVKNGLVDRRHGSVAAGTAVFEVFIKTTPSDCGRRITDPRAARQVQLRRARSRRTGRPAPATEAGCPASATSPQGPTSRSTRRGGSCRRSTPCGATT